ncbi:MAG TPA: hypothetical protein VI837_06675 [Blastocatellia bacterium]|nr:hypothetical protein [Blastocatellia bacterium]
MTSSQEKHALGIDGGPILVHGNGVKALAFDGTYIYAAIDRIVPDLLGGGGATVVNGYVIRFR